MTSDAVNRKTGMTPLSANKAATEGLSLGTQHVILIGASSAIAEALGQCWFATQASDTSQQTGSLTAISRTQKPQDWIDYYGSDWNDLLWLQSDYSEISIENLCHQYKDRLARADVVIICNGKLHDEAIKPEKRLQDFSTHNFADILRCNTLVPLLWLQYLQPYLSRHKVVSLALFTARVGSIEDNNLGGWYSYRASKSALNMLVKTFAVELARSRPMTRVLLFHPGTTDTPLSKPFQNNVPEDKLFTPQFVACQLVRLLTHYKWSNNIAYLDWAGKSIRW